MREQKERLERQALTVADYEAALRDLKAGRVPEDLPALINYAQESFRELRETFDALAACVQKQERTLNLVRSLNEALQRQNRGLKDRRPPQWVGPSAELMADDTKEARDVLM